MDLATRTAMLYALGPALKDPVKAGQILERFWANKIAIVWTSAHIHRAANDKQVVLTEKQARQILHDLHLHHNYQYGLRWSDLKDAIANSGLGRDISPVELLWRACLAPCNGYWLASVSFGGLAPWPTKNLG